MHGNARGESLLGSSSALERRNDTHGRELSQSQWVCGVEVGLWRTALVSLVEAICTSKWISIAADHTVSIDQRTDHFDGQTSTALEVDRIWG
jgi:hypothetical protein